MNISKCKNGYVLDVSPDNIFGDRYIANNIQELFARMLNILEDKSEIGHGKKYGKVIVEYSCDDLY
jgi:hypothetical protein